MKRFGLLCSALEQAADADAKVQSLADYLGDALDADKLHALALLSGQRPKKSVTLIQLRDLALDFAAMPLWLFEASAQVVGDQSEAISLILPAPEHPSDQSLVAWITTLRDLGKLAPQELRTAIFAAWDRLTPPERYIFNKLISGGFRQSVEAAVIQKALARLTGLPDYELAYKLRAKWSPDKTTFAALVLAPCPDSALCKPYPPPRSKSLEAAPNTLGPADAWQAEWHWPGVSAQLIRRAGRLFVWSGDTELLTDRLPDLAANAMDIPDGTVLEGTLLAWDKTAAAPLPDSLLHKRLARKTLSKKQISETPVIFRANDLCEADGTGLRDQPFALRREKLAKLLRDLPGTSTIRLSHPLPFGDWQTLQTIHQTSRNAQAEGILLRHLHSPDTPALVWKAPQIRFNAVMIYAHVDPAANAPEFTVALWDQDVLVPVAKAEADLPKSDLGALAAWVKSNTTERFGPVRSVPGTHVFSVTCDGLVANARRKSGITVQNPRIRAWDRAIPAHDAESLKNLRKLL